MHNIDLKAWTLLCDFIRIKVKTTDSDKPTNNTNIYITNYTQNTHICTTKTYFLIEI
jgi:hypothetical protein